MTKVKDRLASALLLIPLLIVPQIASGQQSRRFNPNSYPAKSFRVTQHDYPLGDFTIRIINVRKPFKPDAPPPMYCRAWLQVRSGDTMLRQAYFDDIEPVGYYFGIFVPKHQPLEDYFLALKEGDYDGRLLLVGKDGSLTDIPGGTFSLTPDKRYLIGAHDSDYASMFVFDLRIRKLVIDGEKEKLPAVADLYLDRVGYYFTEDDETGQSPDPSQKTVQIARLDLKHLKVTEDVKTKAQLESDRKMDHLTSWPMTHDCTSER
ncbi:MAG: hypothetical protein ABSC76_18045 [Terracidiphilus sp.]|jgi:hypothetical protein